MSVLSNTVGKYIPILGSRKPKIDRKQALAIVPVRHPLIEWERRDKEVILTVPTRSDGIARIVKRLIRNLPDSRQIALDEVGSSVWELCDGRRSISAVVDVVSKRYKLTTREAEASVTMFLQTLAKRNLVGLMSAGGSKSANSKH